MFKFNITFSTARGAGKMFFVGDLLSCKERVDALKALGYTDFVIVVVGDNEMSASAA